MLDGRAPRAAASRDYQTFRDSASRLIGASAGDGLFAIGQEPPATAERYGKHRFGQSLLLARRLVERGVSFVGVHFNYMTKCDGWDTHQKNFPALKDELLPLLDEGLSALVADLRQRGMLDDTLVVTMGEFGRTPRVNKDGGRDHWGHCVQRAVGRRRHPRRQPGRRLRQHLRVSPRTARRPGRRRGHDLPRPGPRTAGHHARSARPPHGALRRARDFAALLAGRPFACDNGDVTVWCWHIWSGDELFARLFT